MLIHCCSSVVLFVDGNVKKNLLYGIYADSLHLEVSLVLLHYQVCYSRNVYQGVVLIFQGFVVNTVDLFSLRLYSFKSFQKSFSACSSFMVQHQICCILV